MKNLSTQGLVQEAVSEIEKIAPRNAHVAVDISEDPVGTYCTRIRVETRRRTYFAKKDDMFLYKSFSKALRALKAQLIKSRTSHLHQATPINKLNEA